MVFLLGFCSFCIYRALFELYLYDFDKERFIEWSFLAFFILYGIYLLICLIRIFIQKYKAIQVYPENRYLTIFSNGLFRNEKISIQFEDIKEIIVSWGIVFVWRFMIGNMALRRITIRTNRGNEYNVICSVYGYKITELRPCLPIVEKFTLIFF